MPRARIAAVSRDKVKAGVRERSLATDVAPRFSDEEGASGEDVRRAGHVGIDVDIVEQAKDAAPAAGPARRA